MKTRLHHEFDKFLHWWAEGLALAVPQRWRERQQRFKQYLLVHGEGDQITVEHYHQGTARPLATHLVSMHDPIGQHTIGEWLAKDPRLGTLPVILRLAANSILVKRLRYPAAVQDDLATVIAFDIDRQTPFSREDVYFDHAKVDLDHLAEHVEIDLLVVPKREVEPIEAMLEGVGLQLSIIDVADRTFFDQRTNLLPEPKALRSNRPPYRRRFALFMLWMVLIAMIPGKQLIDARSTISHLEEEERNARATVHSFNEIQDQHRRIVSKLNFFHQLEAKHTPAIDLIEEISRLLGDNTWIQRFDLKEGTLTLQGESDKASEIPGILEDSATFSSPRFSSPVTRNNTSGRDRFQVVATVDAQ